MNKANRVCIGFMITCLCFFISMMTGPLSDLSAEVFNSDTPEVMGPPRPDISSAGDKEEKDPVESGPPSEENSFFHNNNSPFGNDEDPADITPAASVTPTTPPKATPAPSASPSPSPTPTTAPKETLTPTASPTPTATPTPKETLTPTVSPTPTPEPLVLSFTMPAVTTNLNIRSGPGTGYDVIGKLPVMSYAYLLEVKGDWARIKTGSIEEGWVSCDYLFSKAEICSLCDREEVVSATITASVLNVRSGPGTFYAVLRKAERGKTFPVVLSESYQGWYAVRISEDTIGYVSADYVTLDFDLDTGVTLEEIARNNYLDSLEEALNLRPGEAQKVSEAMVTRIKETRRDPVSMTEDEIYLLATIIYTEAGNQEYAGKLAVANVILNRMEDGYWGKTLSEVVFAKGQFAGAKPEYIDRAQARGIPDSCYEAAREALAGRNNICDFMFFRTTSSAYNKQDYASYSSFYILEDHVFYKKNW